MPVSIIYEDRQLLVIEKPPGFLAQPDGSERPDVLAWAEGHLREARGRPSAWVGLVHRLDLKVGGAMVLAKTSKAASRLSAQFRDRTAEKIYLALVSGEAPAKGELKGDLVRDGRLTRLAALGERGAASALIFRRLKLYPPLPAESLGQVSLLEIRLLTGAKHQIRAQLSAAGCPVVGDELYGGPSSARGEAIGLWAARLSLDHPVTGRRLTFNSPPPPVWPFGLFGPFEPLDLESPKGS
ncbi:MAG: RluA family pseudouridine synthase [Deltaproteobacteria bacterium]|jgi:23S rRNA pseudouridine1911/1915/1917 synthase|nr:RluA family pseudouridine synthase [Deltaproteobacteria bacterium]